jgi:predicted  nucleic acid-binding Zn-ribbon protein
MKKFLWFIVLMILSPKLILASEVIYSDYSEFGPFDSEYISSSELVDVKTEKRYLWYKEEQILGDYKLYDGSSNLLLDDCYDTDYSSWSTTYEEKIGRTYLNRTVYNYELAKELRYIHLTNLYGSYGAFRIPELIVKVDGKEIDYDFTCDGCWDNFDSYIHNGIYNENKSYITNGGSLIIDLKQSYPANKVELIFYIFDLGSESKKYTIGYSNDKKNIYASKDFVYEFSDEYWSNSKLINHYIYDLGIDKSLWTNNVIRYSPIDSDYVMSVSTYKQYRYKETYCRTYTLNKVYNSIYTKDSIDDFTIKDESKSKIFYSYRTRDKIELEDDLIINSYDYNLSDFILYSSNDYDIITDIDINKNGIYNITFKTDKLQVNKLVSVDILDNTIFTYQQEIESLYKLIEDLNNKIKELEEKYNASIAIKDEEITKLNQELNSCKDNCSEKLNCLQNEIESKNKIIQDYKDENNLLYEQINDLNNKIKEIENEIENKNLKKEEEINNLNNQINNLKDEIKSLNDLLYDKNIEISKLIEDVENKKEEISKLKLENTDALNKIQQLQSLNNEYLEQLNNFLSDIKQQLNNSVLNNEQLEYLKELITLYKNEITSLEEINLSEEKNYEEYQEKINSLELNLNELYEIVTSLNVSKEEFKSYNEKISSLENLNTKYIEKIKELENQLHNLNLSITNTIDYKNNIIDTYEQEINSLNVNTIDEENTDINALKEDSTDSLNSKLNNYMLKINGIEVFNLFWLYILILILILVYIIVRKKSREK